MSLKLTDVTLRDGLQMEASLIPVDKKLELFEKLDSCGYARLEITSFVHPKWVPQFADSEAFCQKLFAGPAPRTPELMAFVPNEKGLERLLHFPIDWVSAFIAVSESFNQKNVNQSIAETLESLKVVVASSHREKRHVRLYVSTVFGCPYEGAIPEAQLFDVLKKVIDLGADEIALSDTIGVATPESVTHIVEKFLKSYPAEDTALHFHDTYGMAVANSVAAWRAGIRKLDGASGGIGGCPYAKGATGNVATEAIAYAFFRERAEHFKFRKTETETVLRALGEGLGLTLHSSLWEIMKKGGNWYGLD